MTEPVWVIPGESTFGAMLEEHADRRRQRRLDVEIAQRIEDADEAMVEAADPRVAARARHEGLLARRERVRLLLEGTEPGTALARLDAWLDVVLDDLGAAAFDDLADRLGGAR